MSKVVVSSHESAHGSTKTYTLGFVLSIILTLAAYILASHQVVTGWTFIYIVAGLAIIQLFVQLILFLHLGRGSQSRWNRVVAAFAAMVVIILVFGSLWIMHHLNAYHDNLTPQQVNQSIVNDEGFGPSN